MGTYIPSRPRKRRSVADALQDAEREHFVDCPDADLITRSAAILLDLVLCSVASSGVQQLSYALYTGLSALFTALALPPEWVRTTVPEAVTILSLALKVTAVYLVLIWSIPQFGASPGKLLLGLRLVEADSGHRLGMWQALFRETICKPLSLGLGVGIVMCLIRKDRRSLHDLVCRSAVKHVARPGAGA